MVNVPPQRDPQNSDTGKNTQEPNMEEEKSTEADPLPLSSPPPQAGLNAGGGTFDPVGSHSPSNVGTNQDHAGSQITVTMVASVTRLLLM